ncbi:general secretion pathway protein GspB [Congregibacter brevis]|uniref:General secretion pathway protein GspB n=1 Tax=Congregibacter brevis TaxID=3081201 RepID=A0ABZ0I9I0_9GAMM|nr:general secretion pathway protein GspB [Congregibacter sp. IMCC45268]
MSLILDALSRAEREKREQASPAPTILSQELTPGSSGSTRWMTWAALWALLVCLLAAMFVLFRTVPEHSPAAKTTPQTTTAVSFDTVKSAQSDDMSTPSRRLPTAARAQQAQMPAQAIPADSLSGIEPASEERTAAVAALYSQPAEALAIEAEPLANETELTVNRSSEPIEEGSEAAGALPAVTASSVITESEIDVEQVLREIRAEAANSGLEPHPTPLLEDLTKQFKDRVPTLMYSSHDYSSLGRSTVTINGDILTRGQRTRGVEVRELLSDSVILRFDSTDFRLRALNSWVNL